MFSERRLIQRHHSDRERVLHLRPCEPILWGLETYSPYQDRDLTDTKIFDCGDLELPLGDTEQVLSIIEDFAAEIIKENKTPVMIGGEHLVTLGG